MSVYLDTDDKEEEEGSVRRSLLPGCETELLANGGRRRGRKVEDVLEGLPDGVLAYILYGGFLDTLEVGRTLSLVCKRILGLGYAVKRLDLHGLKVEGRMGGIVRRYPNVEEVNLHDSRGLGEEEVREMARGWKGSMRIINLKGTGVGNRECKVIGEMKELREINLGKTRIQDTGLIGDEGIMDIAKGCRELR